MDRVVGRKMEREVGREVEWKVEVEQGRGGGEA